MGRHHLILGETTDYLTGQTLPDTDDERARQSIIRFLVGKKGFLKTDFESRLELPITVDKDSGKVRVDYLARFDGRSGLVVIYGPGAIVSRQRATLAVARLLEPEVVPFAIIANGRDAHLMESHTGKVIAKDIDAIFSRVELMEKLAALTPEVLSADRLDKEKRILFAMEVLSERECDEFVCNRC